MRIQGQPITQADIDSGKVLVVGVNAEAKWDKCPYVTTRGRVHDNAICPGWAESGSSNYAEFCAYLLLDTLECGWTMRIVRKEAE